MTQHDDEPAEATPPNGNDWSPGPHTTDSNYQAIKVLEGMAKHTLGEQRRQRDMLDTIIRTLSGVRGDLAEQRGAIMRIDALATLLVVKNDTRERDMKREHKHNDDEFRKVRKEADQLAERMSRSADDSQQRIALTSHHEIERLSRTAERAEDKIEAEAEKAISEIRGHKGSVEMSVAKWKIVAGVIIALVTTAGTVAGIVYGATHSAPTHQEKQP